MHWSAKYVGVPYIPQEFDCATLAAQVELDLHGNDVQLPTPSKHETGYRAQARQIKNLKDSYAERIDEPIDGQPVLLIGRGQTCHIGVMARINNEWYVLHANSEYGSVTLERLTKMTELRFTVEGFYKWK